MIAVQLKPGIKLNKVYENAVNFIKEKIPSLKDNIPSNFGFGVKNYFIKWFNYILN